MYQIQFLPKAKRQLKAIPPQMQNLLKDEIRNLSENPRPR
jgi:mRNA-degrading endonuclease RelE of RelBE toxin-antitoxin system